MKKLLIALVAAVAVSTVFARVTTQQAFEDNGYTSDFIADGDDDSELADYGTTPGSAVYPFDGFGDHYLDIDTGDSTLWCANSSGATYFDMFMQFNPCSSTPVIDDNTKLAVYLNSDNNLVVISSGATNVTESTLAPGTWGRLTIAATNNLFTVLLNGVELGSYASRTGNAKVDSVGFSGSGALDNYVARTTDPFLQNPAAMIGGEGYASYTDALDEALAYATSSKKLTISANNTTMDGSATNPYQIETSADLVALQNAVLANEAVRSLNFVQTANIDMTGVTGFYGIGWFEASTSFASVPSGVASDGKTALPFAGTYDGQGYTISNVTIVKHSYAGVFNNVSGTVKNLTVQDIGLSGTCSEWGCAIVGNAGNGALLENLTAVTSTGFDWGSSANHNVAGIVVRPIGTATIRGCVNNANISSTSKRLGGVASFVGSGSVGTVFDSCTNNATLVSTDGTRGVGGILGCAEGGVKNAATANDTIIRNCADFGSETAQASNGHAGAIVGSNWNESYTYTDDGGNTFKAASDDCGYAKNAVFGRAYATALTIDNTDYLTTVAQADLAAGNTYVLLQNVAASETPVFTLAAVGDTIAFNTNGYVFAGTVAAAGDMVDAVPSTVDAVITYTATAAPVVATITKGGNTTSYRTLQAAIEDAVSSDTVNLVGAASGAVNIPAGITVQLAADYSLVGVTSLAGEGVLAMPSGAAPQSTEQLLCQQSTWAGTLYIHDVDINSAINLTLLGNANSTVRFNNAGCAFTTGSTTAHAIKALEIGPNGLDFVGNYSAGTFTFPCALTGTGMLKIAVKDSAYGTDHKVAKFTGDISGFAGSISFADDANCAVYFGEAAGNGRCISVAAGSAVTVAAGKTWTAPSGFVVQGNMTVNGTLDAGSEKLYGSGTITFNAATSLVVANTWTGTYNANFKAANNAIFYIPVNASATTVINGVNGEFGGYPNYNGGAPTVAGPVTLNANWTVSDGWAAADKVTTFSKLSGTGNLTVNGSTSGTAAIYYTITELDGYTGTIGGARGNFTVGKVNVATTPADGACIVKTAIGTYGSIADGAALYVAGADTGKTLEYKADGANGAGLYVKASAPVTPTIDPATDTPSAVVTAADADEAITAVEVAAPTGVDAAAYKANFDFTAEANGDGTFKVTLTGIKETVQEAVSEDAVTSLVTAAEDSSATTVTVDVPAGLYYKVTTYDAIGGTPVDFETGISSGSTTPVTKPTSATQGFIKVEMATKPLN